MADYWHKNWSCPFFLWSGRQRVSCEGGCVQMFPDVDTAQEFMNHYCAGKDGGWQTCSLAAALLGYYERQGEEHRE